MTDTRWRKRQLESNRCIHCKERAFYDEETGRFYTLCERHLEIQRGFNKQFKSKAKP